jgi:hypothetical protein
LIDETLDQLTTIGLEMDDTMKQLADVQDQHRRQAIEHRDRIDQVKSFFHQS